MNENLKADIHMLLDYMWESEQAHYEENPSDHHIFIIMQKIREGVNDE